MNLDADSVLRDYVENNSEKSPPPLFSPPKPCNELCKVHD